MSCPAAMERRRRPIHISDVWYDVGVRRSVAAETSVRNAIPGFAAFVSHAKADAAMEARYLTAELETALGHNVFLDRCVVPSYDLCSFRRFGGR